MTKHKLTLDSIGSQHPRLLNTKKYCIASPTIKQLGPFKKMKYFNTIVATGNCSI